MADVEDRTPMTAHQVVGSLREAAPDLAVEAVPLPGLHGGVPGERVEQTDVLLGAVADLPVEVADGSPPSGSTWAALQNARWPPGRRKSKARW